MMRYFALLAFLLAILMCVSLAGCQAIASLQNASATQPSPLLMAGEQIAFNRIKLAANKAFMKGKIDYPAYAAATDALATLKTRAMTNGGAITIADVEAAIDAGTWRALQEYLGEYLDEPETLPPPASSTPENGTPIQP